jgi:peptidoglycan/xylan/chitin deacetylase (PgdA/CDA1 family)
MRGAARAAVDLSGRPLDSLRSAWSSPTVVGLIYHRVGLRSPSPVDLDPATFARQLDMLSATGRVVSLDAGLVGLTSRAEQRDDPSIVITVDDGTADWPDVLMPALVERGLPATFYVSTDFVERQRPFPDTGAPVSWDGLGDMLSTGLATIGSHTHTHRVMHELAEHEARQEVDRSIELIEDRLGVTPRHFAYPKAVGPSAAAEVVVRRRFDSAVLAGNRPNRPGDDVHRLGRHALTVADDETSFLRKIDGGMFLEGWLRERRDAWQVSRSGRS